MTVFDGHSDLLYDVARRRLAGEEHVLERRHLRRLRKGGVEGLALAVWASGKDESTAAYWERTRQMLACARDELEECSGLRLVRTAEEAQQAQEDGILYAFLSIEGMAAIAEDPIRGVEWYWENGARMGTLTWNEENPLATGAGGDAQKGLTSLGKAALRRMWDLGMLVDVSHLNERGFWDVTALSEKPVIASHSNCRSLCDVPRNLTDEQLRAIRDTGGLVGINAYHGFVHTESARQTVYTLALHAVHMAEVMGVEHVACGFDFCEFFGPGNESVAGMEGAAHIRSLFDWLERLGMNEQERNRIARENFLQLLKKAE